MAYIQDRRVDVGELLSGTFQELAAVKKELALYFGVFLIAGIAVDVFEPLRGVVGTVAFFGYFAGQYWLYRAVLRNGGTAPIAYDARFKVFSLFFMAALLIIPISFGLNFFLIPGILLGAKWIMAPTFLVAEEMNLFDALGASWRASSGNTLVLSLVFFLIGLGWTFLFGIGGNVLGGLSDAVGMGGGLNSFGWLLMHIIPVLLMGLSVSAYRALSHSDEDIIAVFE